MSTPFGLLRGSRALFAAAKSAASANVPPSAIKKPSTTAAASKPLKAAKKRTSPASSGIMKPLSLSPTLQVVVGVPEASRAEVSKKVWEYIKLHNLQNPSNKREILCDAKLKELFGKEKVGFLEIAKLINPHFVKTG